MLLPSRQSFTPLATIQLPSPHVLHPDACNPAMDLVVLLAPVQPTSSTVASGIASAKGKGKAVSSEHKMHITKIALWRMSGSKVWEVELGGKVGGLAWSPDGKSLCPSGIIYSWCQARIFLSCFSDTLRFRIPFSGKGRSGRSEQQASSTCPFTPARPSRAYPIPNPSMAQLEMTARTLKAARHGGR